jgi:hypothetical protein
MCPQIGFRLKQKPFHPQKQLKHKRTHATLRKYAKRRAEFGAMKCLVISMFLLHFAPALHAMHEAEVKQQNRLTSVIRSRNYRARKKLLKKRARLQAKLDDVAAKVKAAEVRIAKRETDLRKHATAQEGFRQGWSAAVPMDEAQLLAQSYAKRFIREYLRAVSEKIRIIALMAAQQSKQVEHPIPIKL